MKFNWRQGILYAATAGIEGCWLYALMVLLNQRVALAHLAIFWILFLYLVSAGANSLLRRLPWPEIGLRGLNVLAWAASMLLIVKIQLFSNLAWSDTSWLLAVPRSIPAVIYAFQPALLILISTAVIWWLGRRLAYLKADFSALVSEFQFGLSLLVITFLIAAPFKIVIDHAAYLVAAFFLISLLGISVAHAMEGTSWLSGRYRGHWSGLLLISISLILILGLLISAVVTHDLLHLFLSALQWLWGLIVKAIIFLASLLPTSGTTELPPGVPMPGMEPSSENFTWSLPPVLRDSLRSGYTVLIVGLVLLALWRISSDIFRWLRRRMASMAGAEFEPLPGALRADFLGLVKRLFTKLLHVSRLWRHGARARPVLPEVASVRQTYRQFLHWASAGGFPRSVSQTPHEYLREMEGRLPQVRGELVLITQQYVRTRYGAWLPTENELQQLRQSWHDVKQNRLPNRRQV